MSDKCLINTCLNESFLEIIFQFQFPTLGLPQHATLAPATYYTSTNEDNGSQSPPKYHENGHDTFTDFVALVCQEAQSTQASQIATQSVGHRSPKVTMAPSYFSSSPQVIEFVP